MLAAHAQSAPLLNRTFDLPDEAATIAFGRRAAQALAELIEADAASMPFAGLQIHLLGDLGAGKTTLVRALLHALGHSGRVRSPTYTLVEPYLISRPKLSLNVYHFDLYRFADPAEWADAGFRDYFGSGALCLVEWPQQAGDLLGVPDLIFALELKPGTPVTLNDDWAADDGGMGRRLLASAYTENGKKCLERC